METQTPTKLLMDTIMRAEGSYFRDQVKDAVLEYAIAKLNAEEILACYQRVLQEREERVAAWEKENLASVEEAS